MIYQANLETKIMYELNHPYILKLKTHFETYEGIYLVLEYCSKGELYKLLKKAGRFPERLVFKYIY